MGKIGDCRPEIGLQPIEYTSIAKLFYLLCTPSVTVSFPASLHTAVLSPVGALIILSPSLPLSVLSFAWISPSGNGSLVFASCGGAAVSVGWGLSLNLAVDDDAICLPAMSSCAVSTGITILCRTGIFDDVKWQYYQKTAALCLGHMSVDAFIEWRVSYWNHAEPNLFQLILKMHSNISYSFQHGNFVLWS